MNLGIDSLKATLVLVPHDMRYGCRRLAMAAQDWLGMDVSRGRDLVVFASRSGRPGPVQGRAHVMARRRQNPMPPHLQHSQARKAGQAAITAQEAHARSMRLSRHSKPMGKLQSISSQSIF